MKNLFKPELTAIATGVAQSAKMIEKMADTSAKILDYGCGLGRNINYLKNNGFDVEGCDTPTQVARIKDKVDFKVTTVDELTEKFDYILCSHVLNVVEDDIKKAIVKDIFKLLNFGGIAVIQVRTKSDVEKAKNKIPHQDGWLIKKGSDFTFQEGISKEKMHRIMYDAGFDIIDHKFNKSVHIITVKKNMKIKWNTEHDCYEVTRICEDCGKMFTEFYDGIEIKDKTQISSICEECCYKYM